MKNFRIFAKFLSVILLLFSAACVVKNEQPQVRIVDLQGRAKPVRTRLPELNAQALASQGFSTKTRDINQPAQNVGYRSPSSMAAKVDVKEEAKGDNGGENFAAASSQAIKQTLQPSTSRESIKEEVPTTENPAVTTNAGGNEAIQYDLSEAKSDGDDLPPVATPLAKKSSKKSAKKIAVTEVAPQEISKSGKKFFAQVGSFGSKVNADVALAKMKKFHSGKVTVSEGENVVYRVWLGPIATRKQAEALVKKIKDSGSDAVLIRGK